MPQPSVGRTAAVLLTAVAMVMFAAPILVKAERQATVRLTDVAGRAVQVRVPVRRLLIDDGRYLVALSLIHPNPVSVIAGWPRDVNRIGTAAYDGFRQKFPALEHVPLAGSSAAAFSMEQALAIDAEVAVFTLGFGPSADQVRQLEAAGTAVVFVDFFSHPFEHLEPSLRLLGDLVGRRAAADAYLAFRQTHLTRIVDRARGLPESQRPLVFLEAHAGMSADCCNAPGRGNVGDYITMVGGRNVAADVLDGTFGRVSLEYVIGRDPAVYIATGGPHLEKSGGLVVGAGYSPDVARASLARVAARPGISGLAAIKHGRVHGLAHQLINSPLDIVAIEALARWVQPAVFADIDPAATLAEMNAKFLAVPIAGVNWVSLR